VSTSNPYLRTFAAGAVWFAAVAVKMVSRHPGPWSTFPLRNLVVLVVAWIITALLLGVVATKYERMRSWFSIGLGTVAGSFLVMGIMLLTVEHMYAPPAMPKFKSTDEMMAFFATETTKWVKKDRGLDLDYSIESVRIIEEQLDRIFKEVDRANPQKGTYGTAVGYGAYIGEVFRRHDGGSWSADHPVAGTNSFPLTLKSNSVIFPVGWCWKRLINGDEDNVYLKAMAFADGSVITNAAELK
jgi:hypothetical protein